MATKVDRYLYTAPGVIGTHRPSMLRNQLLIRSQLGKPLRRGIDLPMEPFTYGRRYPPPLGGIPYATGGWSVTELREPAPIGDRDYAGMDKAGVQAGLVTAPELGEFRDTVDMRRKPPRSEERTKLRRIPPNMVFGISTRPSTPIYELLEHRYQDRWLEAQARRSAEIARRHREKCKHAVKQMHETRTSMLRTYQNPVEQPHLWQLPKFTRHAAPALKTFRCESSRKAAYKHHESDLTCRKGLFGHGVYELGDN